MPQLQAHAAAFSIAFASLLEGLPDLLELSVHIEDLIRRRYDVPNLSQPTDLNSITSMRSLQHP
jgi:hypothetical protein